MPLDHDVPAPIATAAPLADILGTPEGGLPVTLALQGGCSLGAFAQEVLADHPEAQDVLARLRDARLHMIGAEQEFRNLKTGSRRGPSWSFLQEMRSLCHAAAERWLAENHAALRSRSTLDLAAFAGPRITPPAGG